MNHNSPDTRRRFSVGSFALGLLLGAAAGAAAGLLLAPAAGSETLHQLKDRLGATQGTAGKVADESSAQLKTRSGDLREQLSAKLALLRQAFEAGKHAARSKHRQLSRLETIEAGREVPHG